MEALRARRRPPRLDGQTLHLAGGAAFVVDPAHHDLAARQAGDAAAGVSLAGVALSAGLGIDRLDPDDAAPLLEAYHQGALALPNAYRAWAATNLVSIEATLVDDLLDRGAVGLELPATALADPAGWERCGPLLEVLQRRGAPLLVHPGLAGAEPDGAPGWWTPVVDYVAQQHAAWFAFKVAGRPAFPALKVCFALLAGLAPLHGERWRARAGERDPQAIAAGERGRVDPDAFVETSSYGPRAVDAVTRVLGIDVVVLGSDRPYASAVPDFGLGEAGEAVVRRANPLRLLGLTEGDLP